MPDLNVSNSSHLNPQKLTQAFICLKESLETTAQTLDGVICNFFGDRAAWSNIPDTKFDDITTQQYSTFYHPALSREDMRALKTLWDLRLATNSCLVAIELDEPTEEK